MPDTIYRITLKSMEQRGASQPNILELGFASDADAIAFGHNVEAVADVKLVSVDKLLASNYSLPYPAGTDGLVRMALTDGVGHWNNVRIYDTPAGFDPTVRAAALIASGFLLVAPDDSTTWVPTSASLTEFLPGASV